MSTVAATKKATGIKAITIGRSDTFAIAPADIAIDPDFNSRDFSLPDNVAHVDWLAGSIKSEGVKEPLLGYMGTTGDLAGKFVVTNGESRVRAIRKLLAEGHLIETVPARLENRYSNDGDRLMTQLTSNSGRPFTPLEMSNLFKRMINVGLDEKVISTRANMDVRRVRQILDYQTLPVEVQKMIGEGTVKATLAMEIFVGTNRDAEATVEKLKQAKTNADEAGKGRVTKAYVGGEGGERKRSDAKRLKDDMTSLKAIFAEADFCDDEDDGVEITMITLNRADADKLKALLARAS